MKMTLVERLSIYIQLTRLNRPIGILLLLWPTLWGVWVAGGGRPAWHIVAIFTLGTVLMRSAGCAINDYADRHIDRHVERTRERPLASGKVNERETVWLAAGLAFTAFLLILPLNSLTWLLAFPALFSIVNPVGASLIFDQAMGARSRDQRLKLARSIGFYSFLVLLGSLLLGGYILNFFGVSLGALRVAGGLVVAIRAWGLLMDPQEQEDRKTSDTEPARRQEDIAFFPMTMPFTTGPGSISVAIALSSQRPTEGSAVGFFIGASLAAAGVALLVWLLYSASDRVTRLLGQSGARVLSRLVAFLLLCIGVQITASGFENLVSVFLATHPGAF